MKVTFVHHALVFLAVGFNIDIDYLSAGQTTTSADPQYVDVGCFQDSSGPRDLPLGAVSISGLTRQIAVNYCLQNLSLTGSGVFVGLQCGIQVFCGYSYGRYGPSTACTSKCAGDTQSYCGGMWANNILYIGPNLQRSSNYNLLMKTKLSGSYIATNVQNIVNRPNCSPKSCVKQCLHYPWCTAFNFRLLPNKAGCQCELQNLPGPTWPVNVLKQELGASHW